MKLRNGISFLKDFVVLLRHLPFLIYWSLYDYVLTVYTRIFKIKYVGIYVKIMSSSERWAYFMDKHVGGGFCGYTTIKIFYKENWCSLEAVIDLIKHEALHQVLRKHIGYDACKALDNVHVCMTYVVRDERLRVILIDFII